MSDTARATSFTGFPPGAWAFFEALAADNTKEVFDRRRGDYRRFVAEPSVALVEALAPTLAERVHPEIHAEPRVGRSLFRINRDTRFSADKTPYKTHLDLMFWVGDGPPRSRPAAIMRIDATNVLVGAGRMGLDRPALARHRAAVVDPDRGALLRAIVDELVADGASLGVAARARVPRGMPADHPNADLLLRDGLHLTRTVPHPPELADDRFPAWCGDELAGFAPLLSWLVDADGAERAPA